MKYLPYLCLLAASAIFAQDRISGEYNAGSKRFITTDLNYEVSYCDKGYCVASKDKRSKFGIIDSIGVITLPFIYDQVGYFTEGKSWVRIGNKLGSFDKTGKEIIPCVYDGVSVFREGKVVVTKGRKCAYFDANGKMVIPFIYDTADDFKNGYAIVRNNDKCGIIDKIGKVVLPLIYQDISNFENGMARVRRNDKWGFINTKFSEIVPCVYQKANFYHEGLALVTRDDGKTGYTDKSGKIVIPFTTYNTADNFYKGKARVSILNDHFFIDTKGKRIP